MTPDVVFVIQSLAGGGAEFVTRVWATELTQRGWQVAVLLTMPAAVEPDLAGVQVMRMSGSGKHTAIVQIRRLLSSHPDAAFVGMMTGTNLSVLAASLGSRRTGPVLISERDILHGESQQTRLHLFGRRLAIRALYKRADALVAISHPVAAMFLGLARVPTSRILVVPNPATAKHARATGPQTTVGTADRASRCLRIAVPARIVEKKRPGLALAVADSVSASGWQVSLEFFGDGPLRPDVESWERPYPIRIHGWKEHWYEDVDPTTVVLLPSTVEGFGNVLLEAAMRNVPSVAASTALGCADAIVPGATGQLALTDSRDDLAAAVIAAREMTIDVPACWLSRFSATASVDLLERSLATARLTHRHPHSSAAF